MNKLIKASKDLYQKSKDENHNKELEQKKKIQGQSLKRSKNLLNKFDKIFGKEFRGVMNKKLIKSILEDFFGIVLGLTLVLGTGIGTIFLIVHIGSQFEASNMLFVIPLTVIEFVFFVLPLSCILIYFPPSLFDGRKAFLDIYGNYEVLGFCLTFLLSAYLIAKISLNLYREFRWYVERKKLELDQ